MAWSTEEWHQDDDIFYGYPIPAESPAPELIDKSQLPSRWIFDDQFYGYPYITNPNIINKSELPSKWIFDDQFYGYPHIVDLSENPIVLMYGSIPVQRAYLGDTLVWERGGISRIKARL